jgi:hypothetical protein
MRTLMAVCCFLLVILGVGMAFREKTANPVKEPASNRREEVVKAPIIQERVIERVVEKPIVIEKPAEQTVKKPAKRNKRRPAESSVEFPDRTPMEIERPVRPRSMVVPVPMYAPAPIYQPRYAPPSRGEPLMQRPMVPPVPVYAPAAPIYQPRYVPRYWGERRSYVAVYRGSRGFYPGNYPGRSYR